MAQVKVSGKSFAVDGKLFVPWGANYFVPGTGWAPQLWKTFNVKRAEADFALMESLGVNVVRVFGTWMSFVENEEKVNEDGFKKFGQMLDIAGKHGIRLHPTGPDHWEGIPTFMKGDGNYILNESLLKAAENYWRTMSARFKDDERIFAFDILNEPSVHPNDMFWAEWEKIAAPNGWPARYSDQRGTLPDGEAGLAFKQLCYKYADKWLERMAGAIRANGNSTLVTVGFLQHIFPLTSFCGFHPAWSARNLDFLSYHYYPGLIDASLQYRRALDRGQLTAAYLAGFGKAVFNGEFSWVGGNPELVQLGGTQFLPSGEEQCAVWNRDLVTVTRPYVCGWLNWGTFDIPEARDCTAFSGMCAADNRVKAWGRMFQDMAPTIAQSKPVRGLPVKTFDPSSLVDSQARQAELLRLTLELRAQGDFILKEA
ncbi:MAG: family 1 glycosylhydrolase [Anaerolineae bacterium]